MSLRLRLFLGLACLVTLMVTAQWWWVREFTRDLSAEVGSVAFEVSRSMAALFATKSEICPRDATCEAAVPPDGILDEIVADGIFVAQVDKPVVMTFQSTGKAARIPPRHLHKEHEMSWVGVQREGQKPEWIQVPEGAESMHFIGASDERPTRQFQFATRVGGEKTQHKIILRLDTDEEEPKTTAGNFFFSEGVDTKAGYITVLAAAAGDNEDNDDNDDIQISRRIPIPDQNLNEKLESFRRRMLLGSMAIFGIGLVLSALVAQRVSAPLRRLAEAAREVGEGSLGKQVPVGTSGEVGQAIHAFNLMSNKLAAYDRKTRHLQAREHLGEIGEISRGLAHTLRNPLNALGLSVEELAAKAPGDVGGLASSARRQIRRIDHSIRSFLALASQGGGVISEVDPGELVQDVALEALQDARGRVRLDVEVEEGETTTLRAVEPELRAVLQALVVNAVEASPEGGTVSIQVRPQAGGRRVRIVIEDEGAGLPEEVRDRLFTPHLTTKANGSGMGLFLAHRIATTRYGGHLDLEDRPSSGTRAVLEIGARGQELRHG